MMSTINTAFLTNGSLDLIAYEHAREQAIQDPSPENLDRARAAELKFRRSPMGLQRLRDEGWSDLADAYLREQAITR